MPPNRTERNGRPDSPSMTRRGKIIIGGLFVAPIALLVFAASLTVVPVVYLAVCLEGAAVALLSFSRIRPADTRMIAQDGPSRNSAYPGVDRVEMLAESVKSAARGSELSRREVGRVVARIYERSYATSPGASGDASLDRNLTDAITTVVRPFRDDFVAKGGGRPTQEQSPSGRQIATQVDRESNASEGPVAASRPMGRAQYLDTLEKAVSKLEQGMNQTRSQ